MRSGGEIQSDRPIYHGKLKHVVDGDDGDDDDNDNEDNFHFSFQTFTKESFVTF